MLIPSPLSRSCLLPNQTYKVIYIFCLKCFIAFFLYTGQSFWRDLQGPWWSLSYCSCLHASPCWRSSTCASCSLCICSSLFSAAVINTQEKKQWRGGGYFILQIIVRHEGNSGRKWNGEQGGILLTGILQSLPSAFLFQSRLICLGMVLPTAGCALQYQSSRVSNDIPYSRVHRQICFCSRKLLNRCPFVSAVSS